MRDLIRHIANLCGVDYRRLRRNQTQDVSQFGERLLIDKYLKAVGIKHRSCVDIGAVDGVMLSNIYHLVQSGWSGVAMEYNATSFRELAWNYQAYPQVNLLRIKVTPGNIVSAMRTGGVSQDFDFLSLDIDSYDYFVLETLLKEFRPRLVCTEINARIPPPVRFAVKYDSGVLANPDFFGCSLAQLAVLGESMGYKIVGLNYVNAFLAPQELWPGDADSLDQIYQSGYSGRADKYTKLPGDSDWADLLTSTPDEIISKLDQRFSAHAGNYIIGRLP